MPETENISAKIAASCLVIIPIIITSVFCFYIANNVEPVEESKNDLYIWSEPGVSNDTYLTVWRLKEWTVVNSTTDELFTIYTYAFNKTSAKISLLNSESYVTNSATNKVFWDLSSGNAIQWALDKSGTIRLSSGNYMIDRTLTTKHSHTSLIGEGALLTGTVSPVIYVNSTGLIDIMIQGLEVDMRNVITDCYVESWGSNYESNETKYGIWIGAP